MKITLRITSLLIVLMSWSASVWAQPANDNCSGALNVVFSDSEATVVKTNGDSRGATASATPSSVCSTTFYTDDTWYKFTTPAVLPNGAAVIRVYFGDGPSTDVPAVGVALYASCGAAETPIVCLNAYTVEDNKIELSARCMLPNHTYTIRVWSSGADATTEGTFRVGVFNAPYPVDNVLYVDKFDSDPFSRGWTTFGECALVPDSSINAVWDYLPNGGIQASAFTPATTIPSESFCDGAVGVNSDFNDNAGTGVSASGSVPTSTDPNGATDIPATYVLQSPAIYMGDWNVAGISVVFNQIVRELRAEFTVSYRNKLTGDANWSAWTDEEINAELVANATPTNNKIRLFLPGANEADSIQFKLTYLAHYYFWIVDDFKVVETECSNTTAGGQKGTPAFFSRAPWVAIPANQVFPYPALADIHNAGACDQTNVTLNLKVEETSGNVIYDENLSYGTLAPDSIAQNKIFNELVDVPSAPPTIAISDYVGTYTLSQDLADFDSTDNSITYDFTVGGFEFALEDGSTRPIAPAASNWTAGAPQSWVYGNFFQPVADADASNIVWGVNNATEMAGLTVNVLLLQWTDTNGDEVSSSSERRYLSVVPYTFTGTEGNPAIITTPIENFNDPGVPVTMKADFGYMAVIEWQAAVNDPLFTMLGNDSRDFSGTNLAFDSAFVNGLTDRRFYASVLGIPMDGNVAEIDYAVTNTFGFDIVPVVRIQVDPTVNTKDPLSSINLISTYPNPVSDEIQVKMAFEKPYRDVQLRLLNYLGQQVYSKTISNTITNHIELINVSSFAAGNYMLQVETPDGQRSVPFIVAR